MKQIKVKVSNKLLNQMDWKENLSEVYIFTLLCANYNLFSAIGLCQNEMTISLDRLLTTFEGILLLTRIKLVTQLSLRLLTCRCLIQILTSLWLILRT